MEQPQGNPDDLQPHDLSSAGGAPTALDLTSRSEECHLKTSSMEALRTVRSPSWYTNSGGGKGLAYPEATNDHRLPTGDAPAQPDDAFSDTTVTLSYVSRSHVFPARDAISQRAALYGAPPSISKFSLQETGETDEAPLCKDASRRYLRQVDTPLDAAPQSRPPNPASPNRVASERAAGARRTQRPPALNGGYASSNGTAGGRKKGSSQERGRPSQDAGDYGGGGLPNGQRSRSPPEPRQTDAEERRTRGDSEVLFLFSRTEEEPALVQGGVNPSRLCAALSRDYVSPLEDPVSPSATSLDDVDGVFVLPQASSSPSADNSFADETADASWDEPERAGRETRVSNADAPRLHTSSVYQKVVQKPKAALEPVIDLTGDDTPPEALEEKGKETDTSPHLNGNAKTSQKSFERKKLPPRSGRGTRLEAIVMNINPAWYKVSGSVAANKKAKPSQNRTTESKAVSPQKETCPSAGQNQVQAKAFLPSERETKLHSSPRLQKAMNTDSCKESTSDSERTRFPKYPHITSPKTSSPPSATGKASEKDKSHLSHPEPTSNVEVTAMSTPPKAGPKSPPRHKGKASGSKVSLAAKSKATQPSKRKRKNHQAGLPPMFSPKEPEIRLKYVNYKEEKRDLRMMDSFSPFVRVERQRSPSSCTVINYLEEDQARLKKGKQQSISGGFVPGAVPTTSCLQPGRVSSRSQYQNSLVCCLCGGSANAMDLGDLHGPYYPEGYRPSAKTPASTPGHKEEEDSDSDSSCSVRGRGRKLARAPAAWPRGPGQQLGQERPLGNQPRWTSDPTGSPAAKRARTEAGSGPEALTGAGAVEDWYSPPVVSLEPCEYWLHEDCSIWSAGVFLVKGKVYGLEEAVKVAEETMCSGCHNPGATLGCFFKGCPNKYHYRCSLQSDCVLIEENFSMKCRKHKNKSFKSPPGTRRDSR